MRRLRPALGSGRRPRLDGFQGEAPRCRPYGRGRTRRTSVSGPCGARVVRMIAAARCVRLPDLDQRVGHRSGRRRRGPFRRSRWAGPGRRRPASDRRPCSGTRIAKKGPTVWKGVSGSMAPALCLRVHAGLSPLPLLCVSVLSFQRGGVPPAQDDVEAVAERPSGLGHLEGRTPPPAARARGRWGPRCRWGRGPAAGRRGSTSGSRAASGSCARRPRSARAPDARRCRGSPRDTHRAGSS